MSKRSTSIAIKKMQIKTTEIVSPQSEWLLPGKKILRSLWRQGETYTVSGNVN
jgi:hypothetical protein